MVVTATNFSAETLGVNPGIPVADAKAIIPGIQVFDDRPLLTFRLLKNLGEWCIRYTPLVSLSPPDGLTLDISGCAHLWGGEELYLNEIVNRLKSKGYDVHSAISDTIGTSWAIARFGKVTPIIKSGDQASALLTLPPAALRLEGSVIDRMHKLGFRTIASFITIPRSALRRRFGQDLLLKLRQALGQEQEHLEPLQIVEPYQERLPCLEPIRTKTGIELAVKQLLKDLCGRLQQEGKGLRTAILKCYRVDGRMQQIGIGTNRSSHHEAHLFKLFDLKISSIEPALGIELFVMEAPKVEDTEPVQENLWAEKSGLDNGGIAELLDRLAGKVGTGSIHRYLPNEHYWPERSIKLASSIDEKATTAWPTDRTRPTQLLMKPEPIEVTAPIPDYPPMVFRYKKKVHEIRKADGPERIEREWWLESGEHRDYYHVEDQDGQRYWLFRSGHYTDDQSRQWFLHGFFA